MQHARNEARSRAIPFNVQAERAVLGSILLDREAIITVAGWLDPGHFYLQKYEHIYRAAMACYERRVPPDIATVSEELRRREQLDEVGGIGFLGQLVSETPTAVHVEYYGQIVERTAILRKLIEVGGRISALGYEEQRDLDDILDEAEQELFQVSQRRNVGDMVGIPKIIEEFMRYLETAPDRDRAVKTGLYDLDKLLSGGGFQPGNLIYLAARPSIGKTSLALGITNEASYQNGLHTCWFSAEMNRLELLKRIATHHTDIPTDKMYPGELSADETFQITQAFGKLNECAISVDDTPGERISMIRAKARRLHAVKPIDLVVVDYIGLIEGGQGDNRVQQIGMISRGLKAMARELHTPVLALSQLSRSGDNRMPELSHLRESGDLEQDADVVLFIHRPEFYNKDDSPGLAYLRIAKQRNGKTGDITCRFDAPTTKFQNLSSYTEVPGY
jgi:replicative DNA helicase